MLCYIDLPELAWNANDYWAMKGLEGFDDNVGSTFVFCIVNLVLRGLGARTCMSCM